MHNRDQYSEAQQLLLSLFSEGEAMAILKILREDLKTEAVFKEGLQRVLAGEPVQQVVGYTEFYGCRIDLSPDVLIPRPETEELVELILSRNPQPATLKLFDIGTGSGCIPIAIGSKKPEWKLFASDISPEALRLAIQNAKANGIRIDFILHDILKGDPWILPKQLDILVSNPPYVLRKEAAEMSDTVLKFEPHRALFVENEDPLLFYKTIAVRSKDLLKRDGQVYFECNAKYVGEVAILLQAEGFSSVQVNKDISGKDRFVSAVFS